MRQKANSWKSLGPGLALFLVLMGIGGIDPSRAWGRQQLKNTVPDWVQRNPNAVGRVPASQVFHLSFGLPFRNPKALQTFLQQLYDPQSPLYRKWLSVDEFTSRFGPTPEDYQAVQEFLKSKNFKIDHTYSNRMVISISGKASDVEKALNVQLNLYHRADGTICYAPDREPSVDTTTPILHIGGLDNVILPHSAGFHPLPAHSNPSSTQKIQLNGTATGTGCYWGNDFRVAYAPGVSLNGAGQVIGIFAFDTYYPADIATYISRTGIPASGINFVNIYLDGYSSSTTPNDGGETSLDIEDAISMAPGLSEFRVYMGNNADDILNAMVSDNIAKSFSTSFLWAPVDSTALQAWEEMAAQGISFYAGSGDSGAYSSTGLDGWAMEQSVITTVGGTLLSENGSGISYQGETGWSGSGGGVSPDLSIPYFQTGVNMAAVGGSTTNRNVPDVSACAMDVQIVYQNGTNLCLGGTSCAGPLWNGFTALVNQQAAEYGLSTLGFANPAIYTIGEGPNYNADFHDITSGNNGGSNNATGYNCAVGYDLVTGWGSPTGQSLINDLSGINNPPTATFTPTPTWTVPVCNTTSGTLGSTAAGTNGYNQGGNLESSSYTLSLPMTVTSMQIYMMAGTVGSGVLGIYSNNAGSPGSLLVQSNAQSLSPGWNYFVVPPTVLAAGTYWLSGSFTGTVNYGFDGNGTGLLFQSDSYIGSLPVAAPASGWTGYGWSMSIYASGCVPPTPTPTWTVPPCTTTSNNFGNTAVGTGGYNLSGQLDCAKYSLSQPLTVTSMQIYMGSGTAANGVLGIYANSSSGPGGLIAQSNAQTLVSGWNYFVVPPTVLQPGTYWLSGSFTGTAYFDYSNANGGQMDFESYTYTGLLPNAVGSITGYGWLMSIYASGCDQPTLTPTLSPTPLACGNSSTVYFGSDDSNMAWTNCNAPTATPPADGSGNAWNSASYNPATSNGWISAEVISSLAGGWSTPCSISGSDLIPNWISVIPSANQGNGPCNGTDGQLYYYAKNFTLPAGTNVHSANLLITADDGTAGGGTEAFDIYVNGNAISSGTLSWSACSSLSIPGSDFHAGTNIMTFMDENQSGGQGIAYQLSCDLEGFTCTSTPSATYTCTLTPTYTVTNTTTPTSTNSLTNTSTSTLTNTPTPSLTFTTTPTLTLTQTPSSTPTQTITLTPTLTQTHTATFTLTQTPSSTPTQTMTLTPTLTPMDTATLTLTPTAGYCSGIPNWNGHAIVYSAGEEVDYNGEVYQCIQSGTSEPNGEPPVVPTLWKDLGPCGSTPTAVTSIGTPVVYPNPNPGQTIHIFIPLTEPANVTVKIFTLSFRRIKEASFNNLIPGTDITLSLVDNWGTKFANGLYYVVVDVGGHPTICKLLVLD